MMTATACLQKNRSDILKISAKYGAHHVRIFGSVACGEETAESDIDFLVDLEPGRSLFDLGGLLSELQALLGCPVDVLTEQGLHWYIRDRILQEARPL